ncbi:MAG: hypothetical protein KC455_09210 [Carnobacterium sp.]|nr:hypothetical protein [Carnobacterium sp.]
MKDKIKDELNLNEKKYIYIMLFIILILVIFLTAFLDAYPLYHKLEYFDYWLFSFAKIASETVVISILITLMIDFLNKISIENIDKVEIWEEITLSSLNDIEEISNELKKLGLKKNSRKYFKFINELSEITEEYKKINPLKSTMSIKRKAFKLSKRVEVIRIELFGREK